MLKKAASTEVASHDMFGGAVASQPVPQKYRTMTGALSAQTLKAVNWYAIEHGLKLTASSPLPTIWFEDRDGATTKVPLDDVVSAYKAFRKSTHGRKSAA